MVIKKKDLFLLQIIEKLTVVTSTNLTILAGYHNVSVVRKRLRALISNGYVSEHYWFGKEKLYSLTYKGLTELGIRRKPYEIKGYSTEHFYEVSAAAAWLYSKTETGIFDMAFDRDIKKAEIDGKYKINHYPDLIFSHKAIEVELNAKKFERLKENFAENAKNFDSQIWILPEHLSRLNDHLRMLAEKHHTKLYLLSLEKMHDQILSFDLTNNSPRAIPIRNIEPSPITKKQRRVMLDD